MSFNQNANNNTREIAITRRPSLQSQAAPPTTGKMETTEVIHANFVERIAYSSCIPGYEYKPCYQNGKPDGYWQTHMIGTEWIRIDFNKPTRVTGLKVQGSGQPGGKYFVKSFHIKVITPNGDIVPYQNCRALRANNDATTVQQVRLLEPIPCKGLMLCPETTNQNNNTIGRTEKRFISCNRDGLLNSEIAICVTPINM